MASSGGDAVERKMKVTSWEMVVVVVIAIVGDGRDVVAIGTESGVIGSIYNYDTISIIAIISISINSIIIIRMIIIISSEDGRDSSSGGTGCIYSTLFDAHIRLIFSRQYHINCLSIQNTYNFLYAYIFDIWPSVSH